MNGCEIYYHKVTVYNLKIIWAKTLVKIDSGASKEVGILILTLLFLWL